jgi:dethiobiotin synthetase
MKEMGAELQKILEKLERLLKHKGDLRHIEGTGGWRPLSERTTPVVLWLMKLLYMEGTLIRKP